MDTEKRPLVTILTVTYNSATTVERTIQSVLRQTYDDIEYIIIDGVSDDSTVKIAEGYKKSFQKRGYKYQVITEPDKGMYDALNKGARLGSGVIVGQINSDDWYEENAVEDMVQLWGKTFYDMAYADVRMINSDGSSWIKYGRKEKLPRTRYWNHPTQFTRRELLLEHPYPVACMSDDLDLLLWLCKSHRKIEVLHKVLANFTVEGMSHSKSFKEIKDRIRTKSQIYKRYGYGHSMTLSVAVVECGKYLLEKKNCLKQG